MTRRNVSLAKFLNTGITNTSLSENTVTEVVDSDYIVNLTGGGVTQYDSIGVVPSVGTVGTYAYINNTDTLIVGTGEGWLETISTNVNPTIFTSLDASYDMLYQDSLNFSISAIDSDGIPLTYSYSLDPLVDSSVLYVTQDSSQFTVISGDSDGSTDITFTASDGVNTASVSTTLNVSASSISATGSYTETTVGSDTVYKFTGNGTLTLGSSTSAWVLVVGGGGGGGGSYYSGGGGAGAYNEITNTTLPAATLNITVGTGQQGGVLGDVAGSGRGGTSSIVGGGYTLYAAGGARAGGWTGAGEDGALGSGSDNASGSSGGGGGGANAAGGSGAGDGNNGGTGTSPNGGGGGGAGGAGTTPTSSNYTANTSNGGVGQSSTITGSSQFYAAGGGGFYFSGQSYYGTRASGIGGKSSGGYNSLTVDLTELSGVANTGSGGGGADRRQPGYSRAGDGGSGVIIIRILG